MRNLGGRWILASMIICLLAGIVGAVLATRRPAVLPRTEPAQWPALGTSNPTARQSLRARLVGLPCVMYFGESLSYVLRLESESATSRAVRVVYEDVWGRQERAVALEPKGSSDVPFLLRCSPMSMAAPARVEVLAEEDLDAPLWRQFLWFRDGLSEIRDITVTGAGYANPQGEPVVLACALEDETSYRRWAPLKWAVREWRRSGAPVILSAPEMFRQTPVNGPASRDAGNVSWQFLPYDGNPSSACIRLDGEVPSAGPAVVCLAWGYDEVANGVTARDLQRSVDLAVDRLRRRNPAIHVALVTPPPTSAMPRRSAQYASAIRVLARDHHAQLIDLAAEVTDLGEWQRAYAWNGDPAILGAYPQASGMARWRDRLWTALAHGLSSDPEAASTAASDCGVPVAASSVGQEDLLAGTEVASVVRFPGIVSVPLPRTFTRVPSMLSASISVPPDVPRDLQVSTFMKDKDGLWFQAPALRRPDAGKTRRLDFNLAPAEGLVVARGHGATWSPYHAGHVTEMGLQIFSPSQWRGSVTVGGVTVTEAAVRPLGIVGFELATGASTAYDPVEFSFDLSTPVIHPFDPTECDIEAVFRAPSGRETRRKAFFYQPFRRALNSRGEEELTANGRSAWRVRFTPVESGRHDWMLQAKVAAQSLQTQWHPLDVQPCRPRGFVRVSERDPRYFETADGQFFYPIGQNIHSPLDRRSAQMLGIPLPPNRGTFAYDDYFRKMAAHGENAVIIWMCNWWVSIEWTKRWRGFHGLNDYNLASAWRLDYLLDAAARNGIHVLLVLDNHGKLSKYVDSEWDTSPYNRVNGGPCLTPEQFFTSPRAWEYYRRRLDYIVARWGSHPNLIGYEIVSEMNLVGTSAGYRKHPDHMVWVRNVAKYLDRIDAYARPITVQYSTDYQSVDERVASLQGLDFLVGDAYKPGGSIVPLMIKTAEANSRFGKPTFSAEFGGNWNATTPARLHADLHAGLWTNAMTVSSAAPFFWWFDFVDRYDLYGEYAALASFLKGEDRRGMKAVTACPTVQRDGQDAPELGAVSLMGEECAYVWVFDRSGSEIMPEDKRVVPHTDVTCGLSGLKFGRYRVEYWDTRAGTVTRFETRDVDDDGVLTLAPPPFRVDTAVKAKRMKGQR